MKKRQSVSKATRKSKPAGVTPGSKKSIEAEAKRRQKAIMNAGLLNFVLLNGKCIKDCTFHELYNEGSFLIDLAEAARAKAA